MIQRFIVRAMQTAVVAGCLSSFSLAIVGQSPSESEDATKTIRHALDVIAKLKVGGTRADVERDFVPDGGLQALPASRYVYKGCGFIKIEVEFRAKSGHLSMDSSPSDRVVHISKPYLEYPVAD
jgi:hypothetical protein